MSLAALYDIHGNLPALEAVLEEIASLKVDQILVGGDVVAGPFPNKCLNRLKALSKTISIDFILGNAESEALRAHAGEPIQGLSPVADETAVWVAEHLSPDNLAFLMEWGDTRSIEVEPWGNILFCHATPQNNIDVFTVQTPEEKLITRFSDQNARVMICGHTHMQFDRHVGEVRVVNAGSVGMPFGATGAYWLLIDGDQIEHRKTEYDLEAAAERVRQSNYPTAEQFATNNILSAPPLDRILAMLASIEERQASSWK